MGFGLVAQLVEQRIENPRVGGSIPPQATKDSLDQVRGCLESPGPILSSAQSVLLLSGSGQRPLHLLKGLRMSL